MHKSVVGVFVLLFVAQPAAAVQERAPEKLICKSEIKTGSRVRTFKICKTAEEWRAMSRDIQQAVDDYGRTGSYGSQNGRGEWRGTGGN